MQPFLFSLPFCGEAGRGFLPLPHLHLAPSAPLHLHLPICIPPSAPSVTPLLASQDEQMERTLPSGAPHPSLGCGECSPMRSAQSSCPHHSTLPVHAIVKHFFLCPRQLLQQNSITSLTHEERNAGRRNFLLEESCEGTKRNKLFLCVYALSWLCYIR